MEDLVATLEAIRSVEGLGVQPGFNYRGRRGYRFLSAYRCLSMNSSFMSAILAACTCAGDRENASRQLSMDSRVLSRVPGAYAHSGWDVTPPAVLLRVRGAYYVQGECTLPLVLSEICPAFA